MRIKLTTDVSATSFPMKGAIQAAIIAGVKPPSIQVMRGVEWRKDVELEVSEATGLKLIDRGCAEQIEAPAPAAE